MFAICSINILKNKDLTSTDVRVYIAIQSFTNADGFSFPSVSRLADMCNISRRSVFRSLNNLVNNGIIERQRRIRDDGGYSSNGYLVTKMSLGGDTDVTGASDTDVTGASDTDVTGASDTDVTPNKNQSKQNMFLKNIQRAHVGAREKGRKNDEFSPAVSDDEKNNVSGCLNVVNKSKQYEFLKLKGGAIGIRPRMRSWQDDVVESQIIEYLADKCGYNVTTLDYGVCSQFEQKIEV